MEIIVPISLAPLQKNIYKTVLERNAEVLKAIAASKARKARKAATDITGGGEVINAVGGKKAKKGEKVAPGDQAALAAISAAAAGGSAPVDADGQVTVMDGDGRGNADGDVRGDVEPATYNGEKGPKVAGEVGHVQTNGGVDELGTEVTEAVAANGGEASMDLS